MRDCELGSFSEAKDYMRRVGPGGGGVGGQEGEAGRLFLKLNCWS